MRRAATYRPAGFFVLRTPLLPYEDVLPLGDRLEGPAAVDDAERLGAALDRDRAQIRRHLDALVRRPVVREALAIASPDLAASIPFWQAAPDSDRGQRAERALLRYLGRMASRATPFGLFAGCAVGRVGERTDLRVPGIERCRRHTRPDLAYLCSLIDALERDPEIRAHLRFRPNSSLFRLGGRWHWTHLTPDDERSSHRYRRRDASDGLDRTIQMAHRGATLAELAAVADGPLDELLRDGMLYSDLQPAITGPEPIHATIARLEELVPVASLAAQAADLLRELRDALLAIDRAPLASTQTRYDDLATRLAALPAPVQRQRLFQVELITTTDDDRPVLGVDVLAEIDRGVEVLRRLYWPRLGILDRFREAFVARFVDREGRYAVPLLEALDPETDLPLGAATGHDDGEPLLSGLDLAALSDERTVRFGGRHTVLFALLAGALTSGASEIALTDDDVDRLANPAPLPLPDAYAVSAVLVADSPDAAAQGDVHIAIAGVAGPSGARMLGRFSHGDPVLHDAVRAYLQEEEALHPEVVFAEIAHLPEPRTGNILHRPVLRAYEIPYLGVSGTPPDRQIPLTDLVVSVEGDRIVLWSKRLDRSVVPRLTAAQNFLHVRTTRLYRFLAALQDRGYASGLGWDWGPLAIAPFLPRVTHGRIILSRAQWRLTATEIASFAEVRGPELFRAVRTWAAQRRLPRHVSLADGDNELTIDFDSVLSIESFVQVVKGRRTATLVEQYPTPDRRCAAGPDGRYFHELSIPYVATHPPRADHPSPACADLASGPSASVASAPVEAQAVTNVTSPPWRTSSVLETPQRRFPPGSAWLFVKLYAQPSAIDRLLREIVRPIVDRVQSTGTADGWFFVRYGDPDWHLRLRFHGEPARLHAEVLPTIYDAARLPLDTGLVERVTIDTYDREIDRYGGPVGMPLCERIFQEDSVAVLEILEAFDDETLAAARWKLALAGMDSLLDGLGLHLQQRIDLLARLREEFAREHRTDRRGLHQIAERYRAERPGLESLLSGAQLDDRPLEAGRAALLRRTARLAPPMAALQQAARQGQLTLPLAEIAPSLLHMHANRLLRMHQRAQELLLYTFLGRIYEARAARERQAGAPSA